MKPFLRERLRKDIRYLKFGGDCSHFEGFQFLLFANKEILDVNVFDFLVVLWIFYYASCAITVAIDGDCSNFNAQFRENSSEPNDVT